MMAGKCAIPLITDVTNIPTDALIPEDEQPYSVPDHWRWVRLGSVVSTSKAKRETFTGSEKYLGLEHLEKGGGILGYGESSTLKSAKTVFRSGQLLYGKLRPYLDKHALAEFDGVCSTDILVYEKAPLVDLRWLELWMSSSFFIEQAKAGSKGINLPRVSDKFLSTTPFPLPPLDEQHVIVTRLQQTDQKLNTVFERLEQFLDEASHRRKTVIQAGVAGTLTSRWREEHSESLQSWTSSSLGDTFHWSSGGTPSRSNSGYFQGSIPWIKSGELRDGPVVDVDEHITEMAIADSSAKVFPAGSVAVAMYGATIGKTGILTVDASTNQAIAVATRNDQVDSRFLFYFLQASREAFVRLGKGGAQPNISQTVIKAFPFSYPTSREQDAVVAAIEATIQEVETVAVLVSQAREQLVTAKRSVRSRALHGLI